MTAVNAIDLKAAHDARFDMESPINDMIMGAETMECVAITALEAPTGILDNSHWLWMAKRMGETARTVQDKWDKLHCALGGVGTDDAEGQKEVWRPKLAEEARNTPGRNLIELGCQWSAAVDRYNTEPDSVHREDRQEGTGAEIDRLEAVILETPCRSYADAAAKLRVYSKMKFESDNPPSPFAPKGTLDQHDRFVVSALLDLERLAAAQ